MNADLFSAPVAVVRGPQEPYKDILTPEALRFVADLSRTFTERLDRLLDRRTEAQVRLSEGVRLDFLPETRPLREADWTVAPLPQDLLDRKVEITGPVDRKMI